MFAVIKTGGRQYRVVADDVLEIGKIAGDVGTIVQLGEVLVLGGDTPVLGTPVVAGASVAAEVLQHKRGPKVIAFKKRRRKNSRRKRGYRDEITVLRITEILADNAKPSIGPRPKKEKVAPAKSDDGAEASAAYAAAKPRAKSRQSTSLGKVQGSANNKSLQRRRRRKRKVHVRNTTLTKQRDKK